MPAKKEDTFKDFILDQLSGLGSIAPHPMFGSWGIYREGAFFAIISRGRLYFRTDAGTRGSYHERGMKPFKPNAKQTLRNYYEVPPEVIEEADEIVAWARDAITCAGPDAPGTIRVRASGEGKGYSPRCPAFCR